MIKISKRIKMLKAIYRIKYPSDLFESVRKSNEIRNRNERKREREIENYKLPCVFHCNLFTSNNYFLNDLYIYFSHPNIILHRITVERD